ncbi:hypothetical protein AB1Y20_005250 [Prymnesium parvum]|uniref:Non-specific serine/threonine protein kinase n=1 Tax=Prymnesium parvum TaxID=97485 RepID=A0AB34J6P5_PRYPA
MAAPHSHFGFLHKQGHNRRSWKRRHFVLERGVLAYFAQEDRRTLLGWVPLNGASITMTGKPMYGLLLRTSKAAAAPPPPHKPTRPLHRTYLMGADSSESAYHWLRLIEAHISFASASAPSDGTATSTSEGTASSSEEDAPLVAEKGARPQPVSDEREAADGRTSGGEAAASAAAPATAAEAEAEAEAEAHASLQSVVRSLRASSHAGASLRASSSHKPTEADEAPPPPVQPDDFLVARQLGQGEFGRVLLVLRRGGRRAYAMKVQRKQEVLSRSHVYLRMLQDEVRVLTLPPNPFLAHLAYAFDDEAHLYLVMNCLSGGDLREKLRAETSFSEASTRAYAAQITEGVGHLHRHGFVWRDLKPENLMLGARGNLCLVDFGLATPITHARGSRTFCGTPEYAAPEIINCRFMGGGYGKAVDWWALGVTVYECLVGMTPFYSPNEDTMINKIVKASFQFPLEFKSAEFRMARSFIEDLVCLDDLGRLGSSDADADEVRMHPFLSGQEGTAGSEWSDLGDHFADEVEDVSAFTASVDDTLRAMPSNVQKAGGDVAPLKITDQFEWFEPFVDPRTSLQTEAQ